MDLRAVLNYPRHVNRDDEATLHLCAPCLGDTADAAAGSLRTALSAARFPMRVEAGDCLGVCEAPAVLALQGPGRAVCVFAGLDLAGDLADIVATCRVYLDSPDGWIADARPCGRLRFCLRTRVPPPPGR